MKNSGINKKFRNSILFIGAIGDSNIVEKLNSKGCAVSTAYNVQRKMLDGLQSLGYYSDTISAHMSPPKWKENLIIDYQSANRNPQVTDVSVKFLNIPLVDKLTKSIGIRKYAKLWSKGHGESYVFVYALSSCLLRGAIKAKKVNRKCKIIVIIPDLPEFMSNSQSKVYRFLKSIDKVVINNYLKFVDGFILFSEPMKEKINIKGKPFVVIEGIMKDVDKEEYTKLVQMKSELNEKIIMLSGNLDREEGIPLLLKAFSNIRNEKYSLWLTGNGNCVDLIRQYEKKDKRIKYFGYIASYEEFLRLQQRAWVFALMVPKSNPKSAYYFPSKVMEYLVAGGEVVCYKLKCIPQEYDDYLEYFSDEEFGIEEKIVQVCEESSAEYYEKAISRYNFLTKKSASEQMKKAVYLIKQIARN